jgi:hypothetical protein
MTSIPGGKPSRSGAKQFLEQEPPDIHLFWQLSTSTVPVSGPPPQALSELKRRLPRISNLNDLTTIRDPRTRASMWRRVMKVGNNRFFAQAREEGFLGNLLEQVRSNPWHVRMRAYAAVWEKEWPQSSALPYPSFRRWQQAAASYIKPGSASRSCLGNSANPSGRTS